MPGIDLCLNMDYFITYSSEPHETPDVISYVVLMWTLRLRDLEKLSKLLTVILQLKSGNMITQV